MKRVCSTCNRNILKVDRWHQTWHRFLWWRWKTFEHFNCADPSMGPAKPRLKGEVPLPFPGPMEDPLAPYRVGNHLDETPVGAR